MKYCLKLPRCKQLLMPSNLCDLQHRSGTTSDDQVSSGRMFTGSPDSVSAKLLLAAKTSPKLKEVVNVRFSMVGLSKLKMQDPFLYYSIPELLHAKMLEEGIGIAQVDAQFRPVTRRNCISFEYHSDLLWEADSLLDQSDPEDDSVDSKDPLDVLIARLYSRE